MNGDIFITFRGEEDVCIDFHIDESGPGSGIGVEWCFSKYEERKFPNDITPEEDEFITKECIEAYEDRRYDDM